MVEAIKNRHTTMKKIHTLFIGLVVLMCMHSKALAQEIKVVDCSIAPNDNSAIEAARYDVNDNQCALLRIKTNGIEGLTFKNHNQYVGDIEFKDGVYYVYVAAGSYRLAFSHPDYQPAVIDLSEFGYKRSITGGKTYDVVLQAPSQLNGSFVSFKVSPSVPGSILYFNGTPMGVPANGVIEFPVEPSTYRYRVVADGYETFTGEVGVTKGVTPVSVDLQLVTIPVKVRCNTNATVYIDDVSYGKVGKVHIPQGHHTIRLVSGGYIDHEEEITVTQNTKTLTYSLEKNRGQQVDVHPVNIIVHCSSNKLYKNNKAIPGWYDGAAIKMMPFTSCRISDDDGDGAVLRVLDQDAEIELVGSTIYLISGKISGKYKEEPKKKQ